MTWALACLPLCFARVLPSIDFPNHLARCFILAHGNAQYWRFYAPHWALLPNLAAEMIIVPLAQVIPIQAAGKAFLAILFGLAIYSGARLNKTLCGRWSFYGLAPALLIYNRLLFFGFVNYLFGLALLPLALAMHIENRDRPVRRFWVDAALMVVLFTCHLVALAFFVACALAYEGLQLRREANWRKRLVMDVASLMIPTLALGGLMIEVSPTAQEASTMTFSHFVTKLDMPLKTWHTGQGASDTAFLALMLVGLAILFISRNARFNRRAWPLIAIPSLVFLAAPSQFKTTGSVDVRMPIVICLFALVSVAPRPGVSSRLGGIILGALLVFRAGTTSFAYASWQPETDRTVDDLRRIPSGSIVLTVRQGSIQSTTPGNWSPRMQHAACLLLMERPLLANNLFTNPDQQPLLKRPPFGQFDTLPQAVGLGDRTSLDSYAQQSLNISRDKGLREIPKYIFYLRRSGGLDLPRSLKPVVVRDEYAILRLVDSNVLAQP